MYQYLCVLYGAVQYSSTMFSISFLEALNVAVGLQAGEKDVEEPQTQKKQAGQESGHPWTAELSANGRPASEQEHSHADESKDGEECNGEGQWPRVHLELPSFDFPIDSCHWPSHSDP